MEKFKNSEIMSENMQREQAKLDRLEHPSAFHVKQPLFFGFKNKSENRRAGGAKIFKKDIFIKD